jgi:D-glycero-D-manno-heptose 1,7-bisphosphate phosphatase
VSGPILSGEAAAALIAGWRAQGKTIVAASGSFDILHGGHRNLLSEARRAGDRLIVLVNSDASVRAYKGPGRPFTPEQNRAAQIAALAEVDAVVLFDQLVPLALLEKLRPDIVANGPEYGADCIERGLVESYGGRILVTSPRSTGNSTSAIAASRGGGVNPRAILLDRDGTLIEDHGYLANPDRIAWKEGAMEALQRLSAAGYRLILVTNQSGIGRGYFTADDMANVNRRLVEDLAQAGLVLDGIYVCPHAPDEACACRKPQIGLLLQAAADHGLDLSKSWLVGDKCSDILAGRMANLRTALVYSDVMCMPGAHLYAPTLRAAADAILSQI